MYFYFIVVTGHVSLGCFAVKECSSFPYLYAKGGLTVGQCVQHCKKLNYPYAAIEQCRNCFCGDNVMTYAQTPRRSCNKQCRRSKYKGPSVMEVFRTSKNFAIENSSNQSDFVDPYFVDLYLLNIISKLPYVIGTSCS